MTQISKTVLRKNEVWKLNLISRVTETKIGKFMASGTKHNVLKQSHTLVFDKDAKVPKKRKKGISTISAGIIGYAYGKAEPHSLHNIIHKHIILNGQSPNHKI